VYVGPTIQAGTAQTGPVLCHIVHASYPGRLVPAGRKEDAHLAQRCRSVVNAPAASCLSGLQC
jgi:hypothetical protein